jgi:ribosomal protein L5
MAESKLSQTLTKAIKAVDKFVNDIKKDGKAIKEALKELGEITGDKPKE